MYNIPEKDRLEGLALVKKQDFTGLKAWGVKHSLGTNWAAVLDEISKSPVAGIILETYFSYLFPARPSLMYITGKYLLYRFLAILAAAVCLWVGLSSIVTISPLQCILASVGVLALYTVLSHRSAMLW